SNRLFLWRRTALRLRAAGTLGSVPGELLADLPEHRLGLLVLVLRAKLLRLVVLRFQIRLLTLLLLHLGRDLRKLILALRTNGHRRGCAAQHQRARGQEVTGDHGCSFSESDDQVNPRAYPLVPLAVAAAKWSR